MSQSTNPFADEPQPAAQRMQSAADPLNPYAAPANVELHAAPEPIGVWRDGELLVMHFKASLPERCIVTGEATTVRHWQTLRWEVPVDLGNRALIVEYGVSPEILRQMKRVPVVPLAIAGAAAFVTILISIVIANRFPLSEEALELLPTIVIIICSVFGAVGVMPMTRARSLLRLQHIAKPYVWISGPSAGFLETLPVWPGEGK